MTRTLDENGEPFDWSKVTEGLMRIRSCDAKSPPENACVAVLYRGSWFYIEDSDLASKSTFSLLTQLFALQAGTTSSAGPILTLDI